MYMTSEWKASKLIETEKKMHENEREKDEVEKQNNPMAYK